MYLFFDTETTGVPSNYQAPYTAKNVWPRMVQLAWILTDLDGRILRQSTTIIKPQGYQIPEGATAVHGITTEQAEREGRDLNEVFIPDVDQPPPNQIFRRT